MLAPLAGRHCAQPIAWGMNCGVGPDGLLGAVERAVRLTTLPLVVQPNAGMPKEVENRRIYLCSPEYLAELRQAIRGAGGVGRGRMLRHHARPHPRDWLGGQAAARAKVAADRRRRPRRSSRRRPPPLAEKSRLGARLAGRQWVTTVELLPPRGYDLRRRSTRARRLHQRGVDAINIPDGPRASSRLSSLVTAERDPREAQIEPILHFCCRDRNLIGMQADLLACAACGVRNILFVTGDPPKLGDYPHATGVFDADSIGMAAVQRRLNCGIDLGGQAIDPPTFAVIGVGLDPTALDRSRELDRFRQKVEAGRRVRHHPAGVRSRRPVAFPRRGASARACRSWPGIWPLASYRNASFMRNEVPGVVMPDAIMERMAAVDSREDQLPWASRSPANRSPASATAWPASRSARRWARSKRPGRSSRAGEAQTGCELVRMSRYSRAELPTRPSIVPCPPSSGRCAALGTEVPSPFRCMRNQKRFANQAAGTSWTTCLAYRSCYFFRAGFSRCPRSSALASVPAVAGPLAKTPSLWAGGEYRTRGRRRRSASAG